MIMIIIYILLMTLSITSYNSCGLGPGKFEYIAKLSNDYDFVCVQETWLLEENLGIFSSKIRGLSCHGISSVDSGSEILRGRPHGGCSILWRSNLTCKITPVTSDSKRLCAVTVELPLITLLIINMYMPTDTRYDQENMIVFDETLAEASAISKRLSIDHVIYAGDLNTDFSRNGSLHTQSLKQFISDEFIFEPDNGIVFTFESKITNDRSFLDHFFLSENFTDLVDSYDVLHDGENLSDHSPILLKLAIPLSYIEPDLSHKSDRLNWDKASDKAIGHYQRLLSKLLSKISVPADAANCSDSACTCHFSDIVKYCKDITSCLKRAGDINIPKCKPPGKRIPGWNDEVKLLRDDSIFWNSMWRLCGCPVTGVVAQLRKRTSVLYHRAIRQVRSRRDALVAEKMGTSLVGGNNNRDLWVESKKINSAGKLSPSSIDGKTGDGPIATVFADKYRSLYNSVSFSDDEMTQLESQISQAVSDRCCNGNCYCSHSVNVSDIRSAMRGLKADKSDGFLSTDHILHGGPDLLIHLSILFTSMVSHGFSPSAITLSTIIPIPKNLRKSINDSSNYRGIALNSPIGKLFELVILCLHRDVLTTTDLQFGYKKKLSTSSCTFVASEVIQHYMNGNNDVHVMLLDASKAFDCVHYVTLFRELLLKGFCPLVAKVLLFMHVNQRVRVRWNNEVSDGFTVSNGVKQGGILSPVLFSIYTDLMLRSLRDSGVGCYMGNAFCGALAYADDVILLAPSKSALSIMLKVAQECASRLSLQFNGSKSQYLIYRSEGRNAYDASIDFCGVAVAQSASGLHLGNLLGSNACRSSIRNSIRDLRVRTNVLMSRFSFCTPEVRYRLFKTQCLVAYGSQLWDFDDAAVADFYTEWRKAVRRVWGLPYRTHCNLLPGVCGDRAIESQMLSRSLNFIRSSLCSDNDLVRSCARQVCRGSGSPVSNTLSFMCMKTGLSRSMLVFLQLCLFMYPPSAHLRQHDP